MGPGGDAVKLYKGILIWNHQVKDLKSKDYAWDHLYGWEAAKLTAEDWMKRLEEGRTIQPGAFVKNEDGKYTHTEDLWKGSYFICADADNFTGEDDADENAIESWTEQDGLSERFPSLKAEVYAVGQSVTSMSPDREPQHRRYRLIFLFDEPIQTGAHYRQILLKLAEKYPIIPAVERQPAQPVFGNARPETRQVHICGNVLKIADFPYVEPQLEISKKPPKPPKKREVTLDEFIREYNISTIKPRPKGGYFVECPWASTHASGQNGDTDAYVWQNSDGTFAFNCSHATCKKAARTTWEAYREAVAPKPLKQKRQQAANDDDDEDEAVAYFLKSKFLPTVMMDDLDDEFHLLTFPNEKFIRVYANGVYALDSAGTLDRAIAERLGVHAKQSHVVETLAMLRSRHMKPLPPDGQFPCSHPDHINFANGVYCVSSKTFTEHTPSFPSILQLPVRYSPEAKCPEIDGFLDDILQGKSDDIAIAHEFIGVAMLQKVPIAKLCVLVGPTHTGKSTFLDVLNALLGSENVSSVSLQALDNDELRFSRAELYGKLANTSADLSKKTLAGDNIKMITAGDRFQVERKGVDPFAMRPFATLFCACNEVPRSRDKSDAYLERLTILPFTKQHVGRKAKRGYLDKLTTADELSGLLNHALAAMHRVLDTGNFSETVTVREAKEKYERSNNSVLHFLSDGYHQDPDSSINEEHLWNDFKKWCETENLHVPTKSDFRTVVTNWGAARRQGREGTKRYFYFSGISEGVKEAADPSDLDEIPF